MIGTVGLAQLKSCGTLTPLAVGRAGEPRLQIGQSHVAAFSYTFDGSRLDLESEEFAGHLRGVERADSKISLATTRLLAADWFDK